MLLLGWGAAVLLAFLVVVAIAVIAVPQLNLMLFGDNPIIGSIMLGSIGIFVIGFFDDLARLAPKTKLLGEFLIAGLVVWELVYFHFGSISRFWNN